MKVHTSQNLVLYTEDSFSQCFGSGSTKGNVDLEPGTKKNRDKLAYKSTKFYNFFFKEITYFV